MALSPKTRTELYYSSRLGGEPQGLVFVPGRIVLLGEHVDHQGGSILAVPTTEGIHVAWGVRLSSPSQTRLARSLSSRRL